MPSTATLPEVGAASTARADRDRRLVAVLASCASLLALLVYRRDVLLYGDAVAHMGIARRVIDSVSPGLGQIGTVWLPLPHLLLIPWVAPLSWWHHGLAASIPSMAAYVFATLGIYSLFRECFAGLLPGLARAGAWLAAAIFAANPNLLYLQATAMTEPLYLALFLWAVVWLLRFVRASGESAEERLRRGAASAVPPATQADAAFAGGTTGARRCLLLCALLLCAAELTRYDGWFAAPFFALIGFAAWLRARLCGSRAVSMPGFALFLVIVGLGPLTWFWWNYANTGSPLDFATGPYSARGIEERVKSTVDARAHPGESDPVAALGIYVHAVQTNLGEKRWGPTLFWAAVLGTLAAARLRHRSAAAGAADRRSGRGPALSAAAPLLLWIPLVFYAYSVAYGSVPIFTPFRWPFSYYNVRYGVETLPAVAIYAAALATAAMRFVSRHGFNGDGNARTGMGTAVPGALCRKARLSCALAATFVAAAYLSCYVQQPNRPKSLLPGEPLYGPIAWREAVVNSRTRLAFESQLAAILAPLPAKATILMYTGDHVGALQRARIPLRRVVNEANYYAWRLAQVTPAAAADYVVVQGGGDAIAAAVAVDPEGLTPIAAVDVPGKPHTVVYRASRQLTPPPAQDHAHH